MFGYKVNYLNYKIFVFSIFLGEKMAGFDKCKKCGYWYDENSEDDSGLCEGCAEESEE